MILPLLLFYYEYRQLLPFHSFFLYFFLLFRVPLLLCRRLLCYLVHLLLFLYLLLLYVFTATQQRPIFLAAGIAAIVSVLLILVGFLAELIVTQGERITQLENELTTRTSE